MADDHPQGPDTTHPILDESAWPILYSSLGPNLTPARFDIFARWYVQCLARAAEEGVYLATVADGTGPPPSLAVQRHIAAWQAGLSDAQFQRCWLSTVVIDHPLVRGVITAINWIRPPSTPQVVVKSVEDAFAAVVDDLRRRGLPAPPRPRWLDVDPKGSP